MKKIIALLIAALFALSICACNFTPDSNENQTPPPELSENEIGNDGGNVLIPNPLKEYETLEKLNADSPFYVANLPSAVKPEKFTLIGRELVSFEGKTESGADFAFRIAVTKENCEDISGVYMDFDEKKDIVSGVSVTIKSYSEGILAVWSYDDYTYSFNVGEKNEDTFKSLLEDVILYTSVDSEKKTLAGFFNTDCGVNAPGYDAAYLAEDENEFQTVIALHKGAVITVCSVEFGDDGVLTKTAELESFTADKDFFALRVYGFVPEGMPNMAVTITEPDGKKAFAYIAYNGRGERPTMPITISP